MLFWEQKINKSMKTLKKESPKKIRIIGGNWRSRLLTVLDLPGLRPTTDRIRETLFNWLGQDLTGLRCLDLFAGTGALGFEAASRGAALGWKSMAVRRYDQSSRARSPRWAIIFADFPAIYSTPFTKCKGKKMPFPRALAVARAAYAARMLVGGAPSSLCMHSI